MMKKSLLKLSAIVLVLFGVKISAMEVPTSPVLPKYAELTFINKTGKEIILEPIFKNIYAELITYKIAASDSLKFTSVNLQEMEMYKVKYSEESRQFTRYMKGPSETTVLALEIDETLRNANSYQAEIDIEPRAYGTWAFGVYYGFAKPIIRAIGPRVPTMRWKHEEEFLILEPKVTPSDEQKVLYAELGVSPYATPFEILKIYEYIPGGSEKERNEYMKLVSDKADDLLKKYDPFNPESRIRDVDRLKRFEISHFSKKVYDIIRDAQHAIAIKYGWRS